MKRILALAGSSLLATAALSATGGAQPTGTVHFSLEPEKRDSTKIHASFRDDRPGSERNGWSTGFMPSELAGLEVSSFRGTRPQPLHFAIARQAGRLDCSGTGSGGRASGNCRFTADADFTRLLESRGIARPSAEQAFGLMAVNARRDMIEAIAVAHYPTPAIEDLVALAALGVDGGYISAMSNAGYRPSALRALVEFKALGITPEWIAGFSRVGYANLPADGLVQLKALGVTPDFIAAFQRIGYRDWPVSQLLQLKALGITPEFVRATVGQRTAMPPVGKLVEYKMFGTRR